MGDVMRVLILIATAAMLLAAGPGGAQDKPRRGRRRPRALPTYDVLKTVREARLDTPAAIVDHYCDTLFAVEIDAEVKATLLAYLQQDGGYPTAASDQRTRLHGMLRLVVSTPEFQLN